MKKQSYRVFVVLMGTLATASVLSSCARSSEDEDAASYAVESVIGSLNSALSEGEQAAVVASRGYMGSSSVRMVRAASDWILPQAFAASCGLERFSPAIGSSSCAGTVGDKTVTSNLNGCSLGSYERYDFSGSVTLTFDSSSTCDSWINGGALPTSGSLVRTSEGVTRTNPNGSSVVTSSTSHRNYLNQTVSGGIQTTFGVGSKSIAFLGMHRVRNSARGRPVFDHSIQTTSPLVVTGTLAGGNRAVSSGTMRVDHNYARYSATTSLAGLSWASNCCHPAAGTLTFSLSGSLSGTIVADFNTGTCGEVNLTLADGSTQKVTLAACQ